MKLTDDDFTSHPCDDASKDGDGLGWKLDTDLTTEGKNKLIQGQKLLTIVEKRVELRKSLVGGLDPYILEELQDLLKESKT